VDAVRLPLVHDALLDRTDEEDEAGRLLLALLSYAAPVEAARLRRLVPGVVDALLAVGLVSQRGEELRSPYRTLPLAGLVVVADDPSAGPEAVAAPSGVTERLVEQLPASFNGVVADIGCGPGTLAMVAAERGAHAIGTDVSPRAMAFADFNCILNHVDVELRTGHLGAPLADAEVDLLVSQPPFMAALEAGASYVSFHGGPVGDELAIELVGDLARVLAPEGLAVIRFDSPSGVGEIVHRLDGRNLDLVGFVAPSGSVDEVAVMSASLEDPSLGPRYVQSVPRYRRHLTRTTPHGRRTQLLLLARHGQTGAQTLAVDALPRHWTGMERFLRGIDAARLPDEHLERLTLYPAAGSILVHEEDLRAHNERWWVRLPPASFGANSEVQTAAGPILRAFSGGVIVSAVMAAFPGEDQDVRLFARQALARGLLTA